MTPTDLKAAILATEPAVLLTLERVDLGDGYSLQLAYDYDSDQTINDYDCYGSVEWSRQGEQRPAGFDGSAEVIERDRGQRLWWQPYREGHKVYNTAKDRGQVVEIVAYGFRYMVLKLRGPASSITGNHIVELARDGIGGLEPFNDGSDYLPDLLAEVAGAVEAPL